MIKQLKKKKYDWIPLSSLGFQGRAIHFSHFLKIFFFKIWPHCQWHCSDLTRTRAIVKSTARKRRALLFLFAKPCVCRCSVVAILLYYHKKPTETRPAGAWCAVTLHASTTAWWWPTADEVLTKWSPASDSVSRCAGVHQQSNILEPATTAEMCNWLKITNGRSLSSGFVSGYVS